MVDKKAIVAVMATNALHYLNLLAAKGFSTPLEYVITMTNIKIKKKEK